MFKTTFFRSTTVALTEPRPISSSALHVAVRSTRRSLNLLAGIPAVIVVQYQRKVFYSTVTTVVLLQLLAVVHLVIIITSWPLLNVCVLNHVGAAKGQNRFVVAGVDWVSVCGESLCVTTCTDLPASSSQLLCGSEDLLHGSGDDASGLLVLRSLHGVRLPTSCLTVGEAAHVVAVQRRLDQQGDLLEDLVSAAQSSSTRRHEWSMSIERKRKGVRG